MDIQRTDVIASKELSSSWAQICAGQVPEEVDVFFIIWVDKDTKRYASWGIFLSTSEPSPEPNCEPYVAIQTKVTVSPRTLDGFKVSVAGAMEVLQREFFDKPTFAHQQLKLRDDLRKGPSKPRVDVVSDDEYQQITGRKVL